MLRLTLGLIGALLLAACTATAPQTASVPASPVTSGVGHPAHDYPGPRLY